MVLDLDITRIFKPGYSVYLGDKVALNRSLPDFRDPICHHKLYLESLPSVSVVIPFFNERLSTLLRTIYSVVNRSPPQLLKEVLVVDDGNNVCKWLFFLEYRWVGSRFAIVVEAFADQLLKFPDCCLECDLCVRFIT